MNDKKHCQLKAFANNLYRVMLWGLLALLVACGPSAPAGTPARPLPDAALTGSVKFPTAVELPVDSPTPALVPAASTAPAALPTFPPPQGAPFAVVGVAPDDLLNLRSGAGMHNPVVGVLPPYALNVAITGEGDVTDTGVFWAPVRYGELSGWVNTAFLAPQAGAALPELARRANQVIHALSNQDMAALAGTVHPERGLRFSPYAYVRDDHRLFSAEQVKDLMDEPTIYHWGYFDGSGEPILMGFPEYYHRFVYDADFARPKQIGFNQLIGKGNTLVNLAEYYPGAEFVEYHFSGFDPQYGGMDWRSLRLVFEPEEGAWRLVGIVHDEWTI